MRGPTSFGPRSGNCASKAQWRSILPSSADWRVDWRSREKFSKDST